ncbi:hypothetical protein O1D97_18370 [Marinomonas sp. 15G1-11]|uniref:Uncharacterized protein n=1 Tax=Marinomonas phaeophyticola TaxID=3004091 RepID=A0ABT4JYN7_9GAMM|nr:hypothetical protein [Marinomonas sp. 15G1-11]MCZ2723519.1 hypothetical protein [Marinomonas sp. 15G1-11]
MSDLPQEHENLVAEPDENVLIAALRNQDDIPILMDIVGDHVSLSVSQEVHLSDKMEKEFTQEDCTGVVADNGLPRASSDVEKISLTEFDSAQLHKAISTVIERLLPTIVSNVVAELTSDIDKRSTKKD